MSKGFAFIEYSKPDDAKHAIAMFNNVVPLEFVDVTNAHYIDPSKQVVPLKVMSKE